MHSFSGTDNFLRVVEASRERLITYKLYLPDRAVQDLKQQVIRLYQSGEMKGGKGGGSTAGHEHKLEPVSQGLLHNGL